jgi:hypothetical protein
MSLLRRSDYIDSREVNDALCFQFSLPPYALKRFCLLAYSFGCFKKVFNVLSVLIFGVGSLGAQVYDNVGHHLSQGMELEILQVTIIFFHQPSVTQALAVDNRLLIDLHYFVY